MLLIRDLRVAQDANEVYEPLITPRFLYLVKRCTLPKPSVGSRMRAITEELSPH